MVYITKDKLHIEIETTSPHEELYYLTRGLLRLLMDSQSEYLKEDYKGSVCQLLFEMVPRIEEFEEGLKIENRKN